jgi:mRNA interferase RelE/StbE
MNWRVEFTKPALKQLQNITDRRVRDILFERAEELANDPEIQGKPLRGELSGFRSVRAFRQRYRLIYKVEREKVVVVVIAVGIRKEGDRADIYQIAVKLIRSGLIDF